MAWAALLPGRILHAACVFARGAHTCPDAAVDSGARYGSSPSRVLHAGLVKMRMTVARAHGEISCLEAVLKAADSTWLVSGHAASNNAVARATQNRTLLSGTHHCRCRSPRNRSWQARHRCTLQTPQQSQRQATPSQRCIEHLRSTDTLHAPRHGRRRGNSRRARRHYRGTAKRRDHYRPSRSPTTLLMKTSRARSVD